MNQSWILTSFAIRQQWLPPSVTNCMVFSFKVLIWYPLWRHKGSLKIMFTCIRWSRSGKWLTLAIEHAHDLKVVIFSTNLWQYLKVVHPDWALNGCDPQRLFVIDTVCNGVRQGGVLVIWSDHRGSFYTLSDGQQSTPPIDTLPSTHPGDDQWNHCPLNWVTPKWRQLQTKGVLHHCTDYR